MRSQHALSRFGLDGRVFPWSVEGVFHPKTNGKVDSANGYRNLVGNRTLAAIYTYCFDQIVIGLAIAGVAIGVGRSGNVRSNSRIVSIRPATINVVSGDHEGWLGRRVPFQEDAVRLLVGRNPEYHQAQNPRKQDRQNREWNKGSSSQARYQGCGGHFLNQFRTSGFRTGNSNGLTADLAADSPPSRLP
jgi:hypothetical protein